MTHIKILTTVQERILRTCAGEVVPLPYDAEQRQASAELAREGLIRDVMEDDQPTSVITIQGRALLALISPSGAA